MAYRTGQRIRRPKSVSLTRPRTLPEATRAWAYAPEPAFIRAVPFPYREDVVLMGDLGASFFEQAAGWLDKNIVRPLRTTIQKVAPIAGMYVVPYQSYFGPSPQASQPYPYYPYPTQPQQPGAAAPYMIPRPIPPGPVSMIPEMFPVEAPPAKTPEWLLPAGLAVGGLLFAAMMMRGR